MSAHNGNGDGTAHEITIPPGRDKPAYVNVDSSGFSMSWKTGISILVTIIIGAVTWSALWAKLATKADVEVHNDNSEAHPIIDLKGNKASAQTTIKEIKKDQLSLTGAVTELSTQVKTNTGEVIIVKNGFNDYRAEEVADKASKKIRNRDRSREKWKEVKAKALDNLANKKPIRHGLEGDL